MVDSGSPLTDTHARASIPLRVYQAILTHIYDICIQFSDSAQHYCSPRSPCKVAWTALSPLLDLRLISTAWNEIIHDMRSSPIFFSRVEEAYYPYEWHINTKVRISVLLNRFRVYNTIASDSSEYCMS